MKAFKEHKTGQPYTATLAQVSAQSLNSVADREDWVTPNDMRIGARVFRAGSLVRDVLDAATQAYKDNPLPLVQPEPKKPRTWLQDMYALTSEWHTRTGRKVPILDLLDAFMVTNMADIDPEDQALFEQRLRERLDAYEAPKSD